MVISDANVLIDMEVGGLLASMFSMDHRFAVPDVIFDEELLEQHGHLLEMGLQKLVLSGDDVKYVSQLAARYRHPSRNDLFALALAVSEACPLLTGDKALRIAAESEHVEVRGTVWLVTELVRTEKISPQVARAAYQQMHDNGRRLPWEAAEQGLQEWEQRQA